MKKAYCSSSIVHENVKEFLPLSSLASRKLVKWIFVLLQKNTGRLVLRTIGRHRLSIVEIVEGP